MTPPVRVSLRFAIIGPFLLLLLGAAAVIGMSARHQARLAGERLGVVFAVEIGERIEAQIRAQLDLVARLVESNATALRLGGISLQHPERSASRLMSQLELLPQSTFVTLALADGRYIAATRRPDGMRAPEIAINFHEAPLTLTGHRFMPDGSLGERVDGPIPYDPRQRPFMQLVAESTVPRWGGTAPYVGYNSLGLSLSAPVRDEDGQLLAVAAVGLSLEHLSGFISTLQLPDGGVSFIAEPDGQLLAARGVDGFAPGLDGNLRRTSLSDHGSPTLKGLEPMRRAAAPHQRGVLALEQGRLLFDLRRIEGPHGLQWLVGVALPEHAFTAPIVRANHQAIWVLLATVLAVAIIGLGLAAALAKPIEHISQAAAGTELERLAQAPRARSRIREIDQLSTHLGNMAGQLSGLISSLEQRVTQRTSDLSAANAQLERLSRLDALTGIANRRAFDEALELEWQRARRSGEPLALLLADIDHFKAFNDHYGHPAGDSALREVAELLAATARRPGDLAARYGGEEFAMILPNTDEAGACAVAEQVRTSLRARALRRDDVPGCDRLSVSIGVASLTVNADLDATLLISRSDAQLYAAKNSGRDRVMPETSATPTERIERTA